MNNTDYHRKRKSRVRYDRISIFLLIIIFIIIFIVFVNTKEDPSETKAVNGTETTAETQQPDSLLNSVGRLDYEKIYLPYNDIHKGELILVNSSHEYTFPQEMTSLITDMRSNESEYYTLKRLDASLNSNVLKAFNSMISTFSHETNDKSLMVTDGYITPEHQNLMHNQALENGLSIEKSGFSEHQTGLSVDLIFHPDNAEPSEFTPTGIYSWFKENSPKYGFVQRYPDGKENATGVAGHTGQYRYVGIPHAYYMTQNNLSLEEYITELKRYSYSSNLLTFSCYSKEYAVYYIKAKEGSTSIDVYVPCSSSYTISGNNVDGFIITAEL